MFATAAEVRDDLAGMVRSAILTLAGTNPSITMPPERATPLASGRHGKYLRATLVAPSADLLSMAMPDQQYPYFELNSTVTSVTIDANGRVNTHAEESVIGHVGEGVQVKNAFIDIGGPGLDNIRLEVQTDGDRADGESGTVADAQSSVRDADREHRVPVASWSMAGPGG
jgi:hypothetical protein